MESDLVHMLDPYTNNNLRSIIHHHPHRNHKNHTLQTNILSNLSNIQ